jgi:hypothetical protein
MNNKSLTVAIILCGIILLSVYSLSVNADSTNSFMATSTPLAFNPGIQFSIPITKGSISFGQIGYYENASLVNDTWVFTNLQLDSQQTSVLSDNPTTANLNITTNTNMMITSFDRLLTPDVGDINNTGLWLTAGWLNYTVTGIGQQIISMQFNLANWTSPSPSDFANGTISYWPITVHIYIDGKETMWGNGNGILPYDSGDNTIIPYGTGAIVNGANSNVSIEYAWAPVPNPSTGSSLPATKTSSENSSAPYILTVAIASGIIVPSALFSNRHRLKSTLTKKIKRKQHQHSL